MCIARKLVLLALAAAAAMAFAAAPASATTAISVVDEDTGLTCSNLSVGHLTGGCSVHAEGLAELRVDLGIFGEVHEALCDVELDLRIGGNGEGAVSDQELYNTTPGTDSNCVGPTPVVTECDLPWEGRGEKDAAGHTVASYSDLCLNPSESSTDCIGRLNYSIVETEGSEALTVSFNNASVAHCEIDADLSVETGGAGDTAIHIN